MARYKDVEGYRKLFDEEYKKTRELIFQGETHLDNLAEGFSEASRVIDSIPTADVVPKSEVEELSGKYEDLKLKYADLQKDKDELIAWGDDKKAEVARLKKDNEYILMQHRFQRRPGGDCWNDVIEKAKSEVAREIFEDIEKLIMNECLVFKDENGIRGYVDASVHYAIAELKEKYIQ